MPKTQQQCEVIKEETKAKILRGSMHYFARNGFAGTKMSDLARGIGIGQGTIYLYFDSKEDLFREIGVLVSNEREIKELALLASVPMKAKSKIQRLTETILRRLEEEEDFAASIVLNTQLMLEQEPKDADAGGRYRTQATYQSDLYSYTSQIIEQGQKEGSVVEGDSLKLADYYWGVIYLYALKKLFTSNFEMLSVDDIARTILRQEP
ncbi:MAG: helix-turn-helix domain-containing protein [Raoultibacter sp.]